MSGAQSRVNIFGGGEYTEVGKIATDYRPVRVPEVSLEEVLLVGTVGARALALVPTFPPVLGGKEW